MTRYRCVKGCGPTNPKLTGVWHDYLWECPKEPSYRADFKDHKKALKAARADPRPGPPEQEVAPSESTPPMGTPPNRAPVRAGVTFNETPATVVKGGAKIALKEPAAVDFIVDAEHTEAASNKVLSVFYILIDLAYEWKFDVVATSTQPAWKAQRPPKNQFQLSANAEMSIELQPRNYYARFWTYVTKASGAKTAQEAHTRIDMGLFIIDNAGLGYALIVYTRKAYNESPKTKAAREARAAKGLTLKTKAEQKGEHMTVRREEVLA